ncbi:unnamed protein product, partial [marine sediment metagenome]
MVTVDLYLKIENFIEKHKNFKKPLEELIFYLLSLTTYVNGQDLNRHYWGTPIKKLLNVPKNIKDKDFEDKMLESLKMNQEKNIDNSIIELLWGDIQLGKRIQACIIMWFSIHILQRPVLYIFRNLTIDMTQLINDITGSQRDKFNEIIKKIFEKYQCDEKINDKDWTTFELGKPTILGKNTFNFLSDKDSIQSNDIFFCLMNCHSLKKINENFSKNISYNEELLDMTVLVDESDLMGPTCSNDRITKKDLVQTTDTEKLLSKLYTQVQTVLFCIFLQILTVNY